MQFDTNGTVIPDTLWNSLYIPVLADDLTYYGLPLNTEERMKRFIEDRMGLGKVSHIDFVLKKKPDSRLTTTSVFIHFAEWSSDSLRFRKEIEQLGEVRIHDFYSCNNTNIKRFISFKMNKTPIIEVKEVPQNIHQIVHNNAQMEKRIEELEKRNAELEEEVSILRVNLASAYSNLYPGKTEEIYKKSSVKEEGELEVDL